MPTRKLCRRSSRNTTRRWEQPCGYRSSRAPQEICWRTHATMEAAFFGRKNRESRGSLTQNRGNFRHLYAPYFRCVPLGHVTVHLVAVLVFFPWSGLGRGKKKWPLPQHVKVRGSVGKKNGLYRSMSKWGVVLEKKGCASTAACCVASPAPTPTTAGTCPNTYRWG